ncbi:MAG: hypothetical protein KatS3mg058_2078 [Roseiflexus sp.]|nr:MAG: hypothetical protein KatS3mg058_2078 [Roseiflexus sp.]
MALGCAVVPSPSAPLPHAGAGRPPPRAVIARPAQPVGAICHCEPPQAAKQSHHCATGAAGRSNLSLRAAADGEAISSLRHRRSRSKQSVIASRRRRRSNLITAPPAQPVGAICHCEPPQAAKQSPRRRAGMRGHCATGAAGRSNLSLRAAAGGEAISSLRHRRSRSKQSVIASRRRRRSNPLADVPGCAVTAPPAQPVEAIPSQTCRDARSLRHQRSRSKQSPRRRAGVRSSVRSTLKRHGGRVCKHIRVGRRRLSSVHSHHSPASGGVVPGFVQHFTAP